MDYRASVTEVIKKAQEELGEVQLPNGKEFGKALEYVLKNYPTDSILWGELYTHYKTSSTNQIIEDQDKHTEYLNSLSEHQKNVDRLLKAVGQLGIRLLIAAAI